MSCSPFDLKDYFLKELAPPQSLQVEEHIHSCPACREELDRLRLTEAALFSLRDEEIPQRIAFVSDKIFEPSPVRRWFSAFWGSAGRLGFASAAMLSAAIVFSSVNKPAPAPQKDRVVIQPTVATGPTQEEIQARIDAAVARAVDKAVNQSARAQQLIAGLQRANEEARAQLVRTNNDLELYQKRYRMQRSATAILPELPNGDGR
ncbi:MAG TPA: zf-HC2 domain-containing protein [Candidatus Acidoferrales bacterium]|nr:zf-HC2 domain-containing protein [Bryobacteraceae bacterium]HTS67296.1 zf-HC2 domain-containing protein [Candidatus Acidoferrales bacterium]